MKTILYWTSPLFGSDIACVACVRCARNAREWVTLVIVTRRVRDTSHVRSQVEDMDSPSVCPAPVWSRVTMCGPAHDLTHVWSVDHSMGPVSWSYVTMRGSFHSASTWSTQHHLNITSLAVITHWANLVLATRGATTAPAPGENLLLQWCWQQQHF